MSAENVRDGKPTGVTTPLGFERAAGVEPGGHLAPPAHDPVDEFGQHFLRCFFCRIGDRYTEDHFCETGRDLVVAVLDQWVEKERDRFYADEERSLSEMAEWRN